MDNNELDKQKGDEFDDYDFCKIMHESTKFIHDESDKIISSRLAIVLTDKRSYGAVLTDFYYIYKHIEDLYDNNSDATLLKGLLPYYFRRKHAMEKDLKFYLGDDWAELAMPSKAAIEYICHLDDIVNEDPIILIAYLHSMYLALLAGGVAINNIVRRTLGLKGKLGLSTFEFKFRPPSSTSFSRREHLAHELGEEEEGGEGRGGARSLAKLDFKAAINRAAAGIPSKLRQRVLQEKQRSFALNNRVANQAALRDWTAYSRLAGIAFTGLAMFGVAAFTIGYVAIKISRFRSK